jgi:hypothetical protein
LHCAKEKTKITKTTKITKITKTKKPNWGRKWKIWVSLGFGRLET